KDEPAVRLDGDCLRGFVSPIEVGHDGAADSERRVEDPVGQKPRESDVGAGGPAVCASRDNDLAVTLEHDAVAERPGVSEHLAARAERRIESAVAPIPHDEELRRLGGRVIPRTDGDDLAVALDSEAFDRLEAAEIRHD